LESIIENSSNYVSHPNVPVDAVNTYIGNVTDNFSDFPQHQLTPTAYNVNNCPGMPINTSPPFAIPNGVPAIELWPGDLNFTVEFSKAQDKTKATPWIVNQLC
jgi:hypothetical protein